MPTPSSCVGGASRFSSGVSRGTMRMAGAAEAENPLAAAARRGAMAEDVRENNDAIFDNDMMLRKM